MRVRHLWLGLFAVALVLSTAYWLLTRPWPVSPPTVQEKQMTDKLFEQTKSQCLGRYLFDVPISFTNALADQVKINDVRIASKRLYRPAFEQRIRLREQELRNSPTVRQKDQHFLKQVYRINENTVIFDRNENCSVAGFGRILEGHLYDNVVASEIRDVSDPKYQNDKEDYLNSRMKEGSMNNKPQKLAEIQSLLSRLKGRADDDVPTQPGICTPNGFISDANIKSDEEISMLYRQGDFELVINSNSIPGKGETLLERGSEINPVMVRIGAHMLSKRPVKLPGINAEEWLIKAHQDIYRPEDKNVPYFTFILYGNEKFADYNYPVLSVELHNSGLEVKNYTDSQLVDIWDRLTRTFKYRPGAF